jgi:hypothetical protein
MKGCLKQIAVSFSALILLLMLPQSCVAVKRYQFSHADHAEILRACRELIANRSSYKNDRNKWPSLGITDFLLLRPIPENVPEVIRKLHPKYILIRDDNVLLNFNVPFARAALLGFAPGARQYGTYQYIDGLWFWNGNVVNSTPDKR